MKCSKINDILLDYAYGELDPAEAMKVEEHVRECSECRGALQEMEFTRKVFKAADSRVPSNHAVENIFKAASEGAREEAPAERNVIPLFSRQALRPLLVGAASVMLVMGMVMWIFNIGVRPRHTLPTKSGTDIAVVSPENKLGSMVDSPYLPVGYDTPAKPVEVVYADAETMFNSGHLHSALLLYTALYNDPNHYRHEEVRDRILKILDMFPNDDKAAKLKEIYK